MCIHCADLRIENLPDIDDRAESIARPALRLHGERLYVLGEPGHERRQSVDELRARDEAIAAERVPMRSELGLVPLHAGQLDRPEGALAGGDVIRMAVAAVGSP